MRYDDLDRLHQRAQRAALDGSISYDLLERICGRLARVATQRLQTCDRNEQTAAADLDEKLPVPYTRSRS